ncbi:hypothetical protein BpHYR1_035704 [Brachionus plicatilis]|uniref:Uncharacterized protein n=1 Tax=Brachionus plicatilis TaxID=10195 RepID=A0A3M7Q2Z9_BRAPC|nr:hypothetical protein BpHYR1_035704 [Brachionus plicatilis]
MTNDYYKDKPLKNGVKRTENMIKNFSGPAYIFWLRCVVSIVGQKPKCYFCDDENHNVAKCPGALYRKEEIQTNIDENVDEMPKTPEYQPNATLKNEL